MSWHALCQYLGMSSLVVACLVKPMSGQFSTDGTLLSPRRVIFQGMARSQAPVGSFFQRLPGDKRKSCRGMASTASSIFFYASFKKPLLWPSCYFSSLVPISRHALRPCRGMPCHVSSDCPVTCTSCAMPCLA